MATFNRVTDVHPGPNRYTSEPGSAKNIERYLEDYAHPVIVTGELSAQAFLDYTGSSEFFAPALRYDGSSSERNARELAEQARALDADAIVAIGAGKLADTAKNVAEILDLDLIIVPTLACACAAHSPYSVDYDDEHRFLGVPVHPRNSIALLVDSSLIARAGADKLVGGIGDTIAKWYESAPVFDQASDLTVFDRLAYHSAHLIHDMLLEESEPALEAVRAGDYDNEHVRTLINTIIGLAGTVGGFGGVGICRIEVVGLEGSLGQIRQSLCARRAFGEVDEVRVEQGSLSVDDKCFFGGVERERVGLRGVERGRSVDRLDERRIVGDASVGGVEAFELVGSLDGFV